MAESPLPPEDKPGVQPDTHNFDLYPNGDSKQGLGKSALNGAEEGGQTPEESGFYNSGGDSSEATTGGNHTSSGALASAEAGEGNSSSSGESGLFNPEQQKPSRSSRMKAALAGNKRKALLGGGAGGIIAAAVVGAFLIAVPLKIEDIVQNLENHFFSTSEHDVDDETDNVFKNFIKKEIGPALAAGKCANYVSRSCRMSIPVGSNPITSVYRVWSQANVEKTLADTYGIEIGLDTKTRTYYLKAPGITGEEKIGDEASGIGGELDEADRGQVRAAISDALEKTTGWDKVMFRYKVGRLLEEKYGIKRCIIYCGTQDALSNKKDSVLAGLTEKQAAAKIELVQRVLVPLDTARGLAIACIISTTCNPTKTEPQTPQEGSTGELGEAPENPETDTKLREALVALGGQDVTDGAIDQALSEYGKMTENGYASYAITYALEQFGVSDLSSQVASSVSVITWITKVAEYLNDLKGAGPKVTKLRYITNSAAAVSLYMEYRSYADEIHTGHVDPTELGSMVDSLGPGNHGAANDTEVGGAADATGTPLYQNLFGSGASSSSSTVSVLDSVLPKTAYAASTSADTQDTSSEYKCSGGNGVPKGQLVCPEEQLSGGNGTLNGIDSVLDTAPLSYVIEAGGKISSFTNIVPGVISSILGDIFSIIPGVKSLLGLVSGLITPAAKALTNDLIPNPFGTNMSGGRTFDMMAAGADVAGNDYAHTGLGGRELSNTDVATITNEEETEVQQQFSKEPFFARMFSTSTPDSLISKVALDMPFSLQSKADTSFASLVTNPLGAITHGFASIFTGRVSAATTPQNDPFGVPQYGYTDSDVPADPEAYWNQHCSDGVDGQMAQQWNTAASNTLDPNTAMPENTSTDPCLLIEATAGSAAGLFDTSMLTQDDLADNNSSSSSVSTTSNSSASSPSSSTTGVSTTSIPGNGSGQFTTNTSLAPYPGLDQMLARVKAASQPAGAAAFCTSIGGCSGKCESAVEVAWLGHRGVYEDPFGNSGDTPSPGSAWAAALASGHAHPGDRNPPIGALLIYNHHDPADPLGHITIYVGNNQVFSTDFDHQGSVGIDPASDIETGSWANSYVGWMDPYFDGQVGNP